MEHNQAVELKAAEKYVLRELPDDVRAAYEDHFFDCAECAADLRAASLFAETSRDIFAGEHAQPAAHSLSQPSFWSRWLRPAFAAPVFAAALVLLLFVGYQATHSAANKPVAAVAGQLSLPSALQNSVRLLGDARRGASELPIVKIHPGDSFTLNFDFLSSQKFDAYLGQLQDAAGQRILPVTLSGDMANREINVTVPGGLVRPGQYTLSFVGLPAAPNSAPGAPPIQSFTFIVEFIS